MIAYDCIGPYYTDLKVCCVVSFSFQYVCIIKLNQLQRKIQFETNEGKWQGSSGTTSTLGFGLSTKTNHIQADFSISELSVT